MTVDQIYITALLYWRCATCSGLFTNRH